MKKYPLIKCLTGSYRLTRTEKHGVNSILSGLLYLEDGEKCRTSKLNILVGL